MRFFACVTVKTRIGTLDYAGMGEGGNSNGNDAAPGQRAIGQKQEGCKNRQQNSQEKQKNEGMSSQAGTFNQRLFVLVSGPRE